MVSFAPFLFDSAGSFGCAYLFPPSAYLQWGMVGRSRIFIHNIITRSFGVWFRFSLFSLSAPSLQVQMTHKNYRACYRWQFSLMRGLLFLLASFDARAYRSTRCCFLSSEKIQFSRVVNMACIRTKQVFNTFDSLWCFITLHSFSKNRSDSFTLLLVFAAMRLFLDENQNHSCISIICMKPLYSIEIVYFILCSSYFIIPSIAWSLRSTRSSSLLRKRFIGYDWF